jgi:hypothetical protein
MKTVFVVKNLDCGWDDVVGVFENVTYEQLLEKFDPVLNNYAIFASTLYNTADTFGDDE